jgi:hypothetical protein
MNEIIGEPIRMDGELGLTNFPLGPDVARIPRELARVRCVGDPIEEATDAELKHLQDHADSSD